MGEYHKTLSLLTSDLGLITATSFGAYKMQSRLRMASEPFAYSRISLYTNPVKKTYTVTEMEIRDYFDGVRGELSRLAAASLWAEVVVKSYGAGETSGSLFVLFIGSMRLLDSCAPRREPYITVQFLQRFLVISGFAPDTTACDRCGARFNDGSSASYEPCSNAFLCRLCATTASLPLSAGALRYLHATESLPLDRAVEIGLDDGSLEALREYLLQAIQGILQDTLKSIRCMEAVT
jgi:DNA repair protein RecO (recombination protein O)